MFDAGKIITGIIVFFVFMTIPIWYNGVTGKASYKPELKIVTKEKFCIEKKEFMRTEHMQLLDNWRNTVVRKGKRIYTAADKREHNMSLTKTCLNCHTNKEEFCDRCHNYLQVSPTCWDCHVIPKEKK